MVAIKSIPREVSGRTFFFTKFGEHKRSIEIARQMLKKRIPVKDIEEITNLSKEEIEKIKI